MSQHAQAGPRLRHPGIPGWSDPGFARVASVAYTVAGLVFPVNRQAMAESAMRRVMTALRLSDPDALLHAVQRPGEARDALLAELTVGESYFFREEAALGIMERDIIESHRSVNRAGEPLRVWSAGCATGEEPYTVAMRLRELGWQQPVEILGTDISLPRLDAARRGRYTPWSLRGVSPERITRWFQVRGKHYMVAEGIRDAVRFHPLNLVSDDYPSPSNGTSGQDLILCRNVLIYFDLPTVAQIATQLLRALRPDGWLVLGASDPPLTELVECRAVMLPSGMAYQQADEEPRTRVARTSTVTEWLPAPPLVEWNLAPDPEPRVPRPIASARPPVSPAVPVVAELPADAAASAYARGDYAAAAVAAAHALSHGTDDVATWVTWIRALANAGELARAGEVIAGAIDRHRLEPELHYLHGTLLLEAGLIAEAARAARRALYLDRDFILGFMLLGDALSRLHDACGSRRAFENAVRLIDGLDTGTIVAAADGVSSARLRQIAAERLRAPDECL